MGIGYLRPSVMKKRQCRKVDKSHFNQLIREWSNDDADRNSVAVDDGREGRGGKSRNRESARPVGVVSELREIV